MDSKEELLGLVVKKLDPDADQKDKVLNDYVNGSNPLLGGLSPAKYVRGLIAKGRSEPNAWSDCLKSLESSLA